MDMFLMRLNDETFLEEDIIDTFSSLIWTERHQTLGDFVMVTPDVRDAMTKLPVGSACATTTSFVPMVVESHKITSRNDGTPELRIEGKSLMSLLDTRPAFRNLEPLEDYEWNLENKKLGDLIREIIENNHTPLPENFRLPFRVGFSYPIAKPNPFQEVFNFKVPRKSRYEVVLDICKTHGFTIHEFRPLAANGDTLGQIVIVIRKPKDLSSEIVFSSKRGDLLSEEYFHSVSNFKSTAVVTSSNTSTVLSLIDSSQQIRYTGMKARVGFKDESGLTPPENTGILDRIEYERSVAKGIAENMLVEHKVEQAYTFQISPTTSHIFQKDYHLGDIVRVEPSFGPPKKYAVTEYIRSLDSSGYSEYPTLSEVPEQIGIVE